MPAMGVVGQALITRPHNLRQQLPLQYSLLWTNTNDLYSVPYNCMSRHSASWHLQLDCCAYVEIWELL